MNPAFLAVFDLDTAFHRDLSVDAVFSTAVIGGNGVQMVFRPRPAARTDTRTISERAEIGEPPDSSPPTTPQATDHPRRPTAHSTRRTACHATMSAAQASADLPTAVHDSTSLTTAVQASPVLTTAVQTSLGMPTASVCNPVGVCIPARPVTGLLSACQLTRGP